MRYFVASVLLVAALQATAQAVFRGTVSDSMDEPIGRATVRILDGGTRATVAEVRTNEAGEFAVKGIPPGNYEVAIAARGFTSLIVPTGQLSAKEARVRKFNLEPEDCDAPNTICDTFGIDPGPDPHPVVLRRKVTLSLNDAVDLTSGLILSPDAPSAGLRLVSERGGVRLIPLHGVEIGGSVHGADFVFGATRRSFRVDALDAATLICARSRDTESKIFITSNVPVAPQSIEIYVVTRR